MIDGRASKDPTDFSAVLKRKPGPALTKWRWEIHRTGRSSPVKASDYEFVTMSSAKLAADEALRRFRKTMAEADGDLPRSSDRHQQSKVMNKLEKQLRSIRDKINAAPDIHGINEVSLDMVREAVSSLEAEGQSVDSLRRREVVVANRILRLHPGSVAI